MMNDEMDGTTDGSEPYTDDYGRYVPCSYEDLWDTREEYEGER